MIKVYGNIQTRTFRILWLLEELELPYQHIPISFRDNEHQSDWFLKINPLGKVPAIDIDGLLMFESAAIMTTLCEHAKINHLIPTHDTHQRARYFQWMFFIMSELDASLWTLAKHKFAYPKELRSADARPGAIHDFTRAIHIIDEHLKKHSHSYMLGDKFSAVDILLTTIVTWTKVLKIKDLIPDHLRDWAQQQKQRPTFKKALIQSNPK